MLTTQKTLIFFGWMLIVLLAVIGVMASLAQIPPGGDSYNDGFAENPVTTLLHVIPGILFMVLGPVQFSKKIRANYPVYHRWAGRLFVTACVIIGFSGLTMVIVFPFAGLNEQLSIFSFAALFLYSLSRAFGHIRRKEIAAHREWMIRVFSIGLGISLVRILILVLLLTTNIQQIDFFAWTFWAGFSMTWLSGEFWIRYTRKIVLRS